MGEARIGQGAFGVHNRVDRFNLPGAKGFQSRQLIGLVNPPGDIFQTESAQIGSYRTKLHPNEFFSLTTFPLYGNVEWRGPIGAQNKERILSWGGPNFRYTSHARKQGFDCPQIFNNNNRAVIYERGKVIATVPPGIVISAALRKTGDQVWIRAICYDALTLEWFACEKVHDAEPENRENWNEVGRWAFSSVPGYEPGNPDPVCRQLLIYELDAVCFFNRDATKSIGMFVGHRELSAVVREAGWMIDFDWPTTSGGPVTFNAVESGTLTRTRVTSVGPPSSDRVWSESTTGTVVCFRDWDLNDNEVQGTYSGSGSIDVNFHFGGTFQNLQVSDDRGFTLAIPGWSFPQQGTRNWSINEDFEGGGLTGTGNSSTERLLVVGVNLRTGIVSYYDQVNAAPAYTVFLGFLFKSDTTEDFHHNSKFNSSLGSIEHVNDPGPDGTAQLAWPDNFVGFVPPIPAGTIVTEFTVLPRNFIAPQGVPSFVNRFLEGRVEYQFDTEFGNELVHLEHPSEIGWFFGQQRPNPAFPPENLLTGDDMKTLHDIDFSTDQIGIT